MSLSGMLPSLVDLEMTYLNAMTGTIFARFGLRCLCSSLLQKWTNLHRRLAVSRSGGKTSSVVMGCHRTLGDLLVVSLLTTLNDYH